MKIVSAAVVFAVLLMAAVQPVHLDFSKAKDGQSPVIVSLDVCNQSMPGLSGVDSDTAFIDQCVQLPFLIEANGRFAARNNSSKPAVFANPIEQPPRV